jgi:hypothetical protein
MELRIQDWNMPSGVARMSASGFLEDVMHAEKPAAVVFTSNVV